MAYTLDKKLKELEFERKQVQQHLALLDNKIYTLRKAIQIMEEENRDITEYDTEQFQYRTCRRRFTTNSSTLIIRLLKTKPNRYWRVEEITKAILIADNQPNTPVNRTYIKNVHAAMDRLFKKGIVERESDKAHKVALWKLKS
ncbi:hypothetical protein [Pasteurella multocida]|uniref:hypothetical protein n=1 Tax=Pasteurella multocida TaxID=747 RepID=UPI00099DB2C5|nr:hypothetical protein [Pasteurella multocida]MCL7766815.1 hypothetical protein [Pasteurella multocida]MCL7824992.1 hypothetical protein [Pasteurella multocida]MCL7829373.1 hypothetical protein [Pasteurella multocida]MCL7833726.1 hypothetical protein [Pasteurella multocida]OPC86238.1 hypothetical protein BTV54_07610 [Pasteurella multocida subsp. multocida]